MTSRAIGFSGEPKGNGSRAVEKLFSPEFRNRLDEVVSFERLGPEVMAQVVDKFVAEVDRELKGRKVKLVLAPAARAFLAEKAYSPLFGARPLGRVIQAELKDRLAEELLFGKLTRGGTVRVEVSPPPEPRLVFEIEAAA